MYIHAFQQQQQQALMQNYQQAMLSHASSNGQSIDASQQQQSNQQIATMTTPLMAQGMSLQQAQMMHMQHQQQQHVMQQHQQQQQHQQAMFQQQQALQLQQQTLQHQQLPYGVILVQTPLDYQNGIPRVSINMQQQYQPQITNIQQQPQPQHQTQSLTLQMSHQTNQLQSQLQSQHQTQPQALQLTQHTQQQQSQLQSHHQTQPHTLQLPQHNKQQQPQHQTSQQFMQHQPQLLSQHQAHQQMLNLPQLQMQQPQQLSQLFNNSVPQQPLLLKTVNSSGMLLPLVSQHPGPPPANHLLQAYNQPAHVEGQVQQCATVIQQALNDPNLASAGHLLLQAMNASSTFMSSLIEQQKSDDDPCKEVSYSEVSTGKQQIYLNSQVESRQDRPVPKIVTSHEITKPLQTYSDPFGPYENIGSILNTEPDPSISHCSITDVTKNLSENVTLPSVSSNPSCVASPETIECKVINTVISVPEQEEERPQSQTQPKIVASKAKVLPYKASCGQIEKAHCIKPQITMAFQGTPQQYLMAIVKDRGYACQRLSSCEADYPRDPSPLQVASFGTEVVKAVNSGDTNALKAFLECGLSPNPCNSFGDSILSLLCKRADERIFQVFMEHNCDLQVSDAFGRTPLHHLACSGAFSRQMVKSILDRDLLQLLVQDTQGKCALEYVRKEHFSDWIGFLKEHIETYWPVDKSMSPLLTATLPKERGPGTDPINCLSVALAAQVAMGKVSIEDVAKMDANERMTFSDAPLPEKFTLFGATMS